MSDEATEAAPEVVPAAEAPAKKARKTKDTVEMVILRDYWLKGDGSDDDRVRAGTKVEIDVETAMSALENGLMRRATAADE